jgi:hypothetical protein
MTFAGKTEESLPPLHIREQCKKELDELGVAVEFNLSANHWANQTTTVGAIKHVSQLIREERSEAGREVGAPLGYCLDCWPTNLTSITSSAIAEHLPQKPGRFIIPAKGTGLYQINDTDCHGPVKKEYKDIFSRWFATRVKYWRKKKNSGEIDAKKYKEEVDNLRSWPVIRAKIPMFMVDMVKYLLQKKVYDSGQAPTTLMGNGFNVKYWNTIADPTWRAESDSRRLRRQQEARKKRDDLIVTIGADIPEGPQRDAALAAVPSAEALEAEYIGDVERRLAEAEEAQHLSEVPNPKRRKTKTNQTRTGSSKAKGKRDRERRQKEEEEAEQEGDEALESGLDPKARAKAAKKAAKNKNTRKKPAKRRRQDEDEVDDEDEDDDDDDDDDDDEDVFRGRGRGKPKPKKASPPMELSSDEENDDVDEENVDVDEDEEDELIREIEDGVDEGSGSRPALQIGARVQLNNGDIFWCSQQEGLEFLLENRSTGYKSNKVLGCIRGQTRRGLWRVQWFSDDAPKKLFDMPPARIHTLLSHEWSKDTEAKFRPIYEVHSCSFSTITLGMSLTPSLPSTSNGFLTPGNYVVEYVSFSRTVN